jgi:hypothetical protein
VKVFISWSGQKSREVAVALRDWLPLVINSVEPFVSSEDINAGTRWQGEIAGALQTTNFGLVCVTRENHGAPWLNFEAGALAKAVDSSRVVPLAIDLKPSDIENPSAAAHRHGDRGGAQVDQCCERSIAVQRAHHASLRDALAAS